MFKSSLIQKIEKYLSQEYLEKPQFREYMKSARPDRKADVEAVKIAAPRPSYSAPQRQEKYLQVPSFASSASDVEKYLDDSLEETTFAKKLNQYIYEKDLTTALIYGRCLVDRKLISKITSREDYHPSKSTVFALCIGLRLNLQEGEEFLSLAGYSFNRSDKYDLIIKFMLENEIYDLDIINEMLLHFGQPCFE